MATMYKWGKYKAMEYEAYEEKVLNRDSDGHKGIAVNSSYTIVENEYKLTGPSTFLGDKPIGYRVAKYPAKYPLDDYMDSDYHYLSTGMFLYTFTMGGTSYSKISLVKRYAKGSYLTSVTSTSKSAYPQNGRHTDGYWYVYEGLANQAPTISDTDEDLGPQRKPFTKDFYVDDSDTTQTLNVTVKLNGATIQTISNATRKQNYTVDIDQSTFDNLTLNAVNTIEISVSDGNGATAIRRWTFTRSNSNPTVSVDITNAGEQNLPFSLTFTPDDQDGDEITCKIFLDDVQVADLGSVTRGEKKTYTLGKMDFSKLRNGAHKVKIEVTDTNGGKGYGFVDFTKNLTSAYYKFTKETEGQALFVTVQLMAEIAEGAKVTVKVCNNALDTDPTWEEVPSEKVGGEYKFSNSTKTADNWAVGIWIQIDRGTATKDSYWYGAVGSYR